MNDFTCMKSVRDRKQICGCQGLGGGEEHITVSRVQGFFRNDGEVRKLDNGDSGTHCEST